MSYLKYLRAAALTGVLIVPVAFAACGGGDDGGSSSNGDTTAGRAKGEEGVPDGAPFIDQNNLKFIPTKITANAGEKIYFKNSETALHTVTIDGKNESGNMKKDHVFEWTPPGPGDYKITCDFHPQMKSEVVVK
ncbi:MAG TPA: cupredoxin domain-containing protein [Tepidiformaceae bacterium]|nr:cupredoxin domain-containing protein [Tepidiformaceae bacterium]